MSKIQILSITTASILYAAGFIALFIFFWSATSYTNSGDSSIKGELNLIAWVSACYSAGINLTALCLTYVIRAKTNKVQKVILAIPATLSALALLATIIIPPFSS